MDRSILWLLSLLFHTILALQGTQLQCIEPTSQHQENISCTGVECINANKECPTASVCRIHCHPDANCTLMTINATSATYLQVDCHSRSVCNALTIFTPQRSNSACSASIIVDTTAIQNINIYAINGFNTTHIELSPSLNHSLSDSDHVGTIHCGVDWSHSCLISAATSMCTIHSNGSTSQCAAPSPEMTPVQYGPSNGNNDALLYTSTVMSCVILLLCIAMAVIYYKTKDQYSGRLPKPKEYSYDPAFGYNLRQQTGDSIVDRAHTMSSGNAAAHTDGGNGVNGHSTRASLSNYKFAPSGAHSISAMSLSARNDIANHFLNTTVGSLTLDPNMVRASRDSFTSTKKLNNDSTVELEIAERQKPKFSVSAAPGIGVINEDHSTDFPNQRSTVTDVDSDDGKRSSDTPEPDHEQQTHQNERTEAMSAKQNADEEDDEVLNDISYPDQAKHMIVISSSEHTLVINGNGAGHTPRTPNTPHREDDEHKDDNVNTEHDDDDDDDNHMDGNVSE